MVAYIRYFRSNGNLYRTTDDYATSTKIYQLAGQQLGWHLFSSVKGVVVKSETEWLGQQNADRTKLISTTNAGVSWTVGPSLGTIQNVIYDQPRNRVIVTTNAGIYVSTDFGATATVISGTQNFKVGKAIVTSTGGIYFTIWGKVDNSAGGPGVGYLDINYSLSHPTTLLANDKAYTNGQKLIVIENVSGVGDVVYYHRSNSSTMGYWTRTFSSGGYDSASFNADTGLTYDLFFGIGSKLFQFGRDAGGPKISYIEPSSSNITPSFTRASLTIANGINTTGVNWSFPDLNSIQLDGKYAVLVNADSSANYYVETSDLSNFTLKSAAFVSGSTLELIQPTSNYTLNSAPTNISLSASSILEGNAVNAVIGSLSAVDPDAGDSVTFSIVSGSDKFNLSGNQLRASIPFDYETATAHSVTIRATDSGGLYKDQAFTVNITNANEAPSDILLSASSIQEGNAVNAVIGTLSAIDPDTGNTSFTFSIIGGNYNQYFSISGNELRAAVVLDYETIQSALLSIKAIDAGGAELIKNFTINILNSTADDPVSLPAAQAMVGGKIKASVNADPRVAPVRKSDGSALPTGSVVRNTANSQKFVKKAGSETDYVAVQATVPVAWKWNSDGDVAFAVLQDM